MKNMVEWRPSKFVYRRGKLAASRDTNEVDVASRLVASRVAHLYDLYIKDHCTGRLIDLGVWQGSFFTRRTVNTSTT